MYFVGFNKVESHTSHELSLDILIKLKLNSTRRGTYVSQIMFNVE